MTLKHALFQSARPIWPTGYRDAMNLTVGLRCVVVPATDAVLRLVVTTRHSYRAWHNGRFIGCGPARSAHGHVRVDVHDLSAGAGQHLVAIEVNAAHVPCYAEVDEHPLVQAELLVNGEVSAATGVDGLPAGWLTIIPGERVRQVQRMSRQRGFAEAWELAPRSIEWRCRAEAVFVGVPVEVVAEPVLQERVVPQPEYRCVAPRKVVAEGVLVTRPDPTWHAWEERMREAAGKTLAGYPAESWTVDLSGELARLEWRKQPGCMPTFTAGTWRLFDFGANETGFIRARLTCAERSILYLVGDELEQDGTCDCRRMEYLAGARFELAPGQYDLEMTEAITARYVAVLVLSGSMTVETVEFRQYERATSAAFFCPDTGLMDVFDAGVKTFAHNAIDLYMDCPSRERAGWLCDSFFTGRAEPWLTGDSVAETVFLDNYARCPALDYLPPGMLPKCYPSDGPTIRGGSATHIPNWALWLVLQIEDYAERGGDGAVVESFRQRVADLFAFLERSRNGDGLLEKLESWVFVDWSEANQHVQDVSYPTNLLYAAALDAAGRLYGETDWCRRAAAVRQTVLAQSWDGTAFVDNARRDETGRLVSTGVHTEACQYYAFYFGIATPVSHPNLWRELLTTGSAAPGVVNPRLARAGMLPALHLRLLLLARHGEWQRLATELREAFLPMAQLTGTLWEHAHPRNSCDHGFQAHVVDLLLRHVLGLQIDRRARVITLEPPAGDMPWCRARIPLGGTWLDAGWRRDDGQVVVDVQGVPDGWQFVRRTTSDERPAS